MTDLMRDSLDHCVKCTICETYCPVSAATPLFPGPKYAGPQAERYRGTGESPDVSLDELPAATFRASLTAWTKPIV